MSAINSVEMNGQIYQSKSVFSLADILATAKQRNRQFLGKVPTKMNLTIGKLAKKAGVNVETIRYYERTGLINQPVKPPVGFRRYDQGILDTVLFIKKAQTLGFKLDEVKHLLVLSVGHCAEIQSLAEAKLEDVQSKIRDLSQLESVLADLVKQCQARADKADCPIVETLLPSHNG